MPLLPHAASLVGDPQVRHRGTLGGTAAHCDPASDLPTALLALGGAVVAQGPAGRRSIPVTEFFLGFFETALEPDEMIVELRVPRTGAGGLGLREVHPAGERLADRGGGRGAGPGRAGQHGRRGACGRPRPRRRSPRGASIEEAAALADEGTSPVADMHADEEYRRHLARLLTRRALENRRLIAWLCRKSGTRAHVRETRVSGRRRRG